MSQRKTILIGIGGASGSGKTTIAHELTRLFKAQSPIILGQDCYYHDLSHLSPAKRNSTNFDYPESIDFGLMHKHMKLLVSGSPVDCPQYDFKTHCRTPQTRRIIPTDLLIVEGTMILTHEFIVQTMDLRVYVETPLDVCLGRRIARDIETRRRSRESILNQYYATVEPMFWQFVKPTKAHADIVVSGEHPPSKSAKIITEKIRTLGILKIGDQ